MQKSFDARIRALEAAQEPSWPAFACIHAVDYAALIDLATPEATRVALIEAYQLGAGQKLYIGICGCDPPEACRVCDDAPLLSATIRHPLS